VVRCHKKRNWNWIRTGQHGWPLDVHRELILTIWMSISPGWKWRRDRLHQYFHLWEVLTRWMHRAVCLHYWHTARTPMHTPQDMSQEVSSQSQIQNRLWEAHSTTLSHDYMELYSTSSNWRKQ
jgi:hypothetical protein